MSDNVTDITVPILIDIRDQLRAHTGQLAELVVRLDGTNQRIDSLIAASGSGRRDHEERIERLESRVDKLDKRKR